MASPEQKAAIKKRYVEIISASIPEGPDKQKLIEEALKLDEKGFATPAQTAAAKQAYSEIIPTVSKKQEAVAEGALGSKEQTVKLEQTRSTFVDQRAKTLEKSGLTPEVARVRAQKEFESTYTTPVTTPYGDLKERQADTVIEPAAPLQLQKEAIVPGTFFPAALRPQTALPQSAIAGEKARLNKPIAPTATGPGPDWEQIKDELMKEGLTSEEASNHLIAMKSAYNVNLQNKSTQLANEKKPLPKDFPQTVWQDTVKELSDIPNAIKNKSTYIKEEAYKGSQDPWILAFSKQTTPGEGVPNLSKAQGEYINKLQDSEIAAKRNALEKEYAAKPLIVQRTEVSEVRGGSKPVTKSVALSGKEKEAELDKMAREGVVKPFWTDPEEVKRRLQNPEKYTQPGVFTDTSAFGAQQENVVGWLTRSAMAPLNVSAEFLYTAGMTGFGETSDAVAEARRRVRPEAYKDNPYLLNIAEGRGFTGNAKELAKITGLDTAKTIGAITIPESIPLTVGDLYVAGNFAADLLDPTLDIAAGVTKGAKVAADVFRAGKELGIETKTLTKLAGESAVKSAAATAITENPAANFINNLSKKYAGKSVSTGDVRLLLGEKAADEYLKGVRPQAGTESKLIEEIQKQEDAFAKLGSETEIEKVERIISKDDLKNAITEAYVRNPSVRSEITTVESAAKAAGKNVADARLDLVINNMNVNNAVWEALVRQTARKAVFEATKGSVLESGLIALTRNTFATEDIANKVMKDVAKSDMSKAIEKIKSTPGNYTFGTIEIPSATAGKKSVDVVTGYKIDAPTKQIIVNELERLQERGIIAPQKLETAVANVSDNFVSSETLRTIIDSNVDEAAKKYSVATGSDIRELTPTVSKELSKPLEVRDFSAGGLKNWMLDKKLNRPTEVLTPMQRTFVNDVVGKVSKLDVKLRTDVTRMIENADFRRAYGVPDGSVPTRKQAIGYLIAGPKPQQEIDYLNRTLKLAMDKMFSSDKYVQDLFDVFQGIKVDNTTDIWNVAGREKLDAVIENSSKQIANNPALFESELKKLIDEVEKLAGKDENLKADVGVVKKAKGDVTNELIISSYYSAEANRAVRQSLDEIVKNDFGYISKKYDEMSTETKAFLDRFAPSKPLSRHPPLKLTDDEMKLLTDKIDDVEKEIERLQNELRTIDTSPYLSEIQRSEMDAKYKKLIYEKEKEAVKLENELNKPANEWVKSQEDYQSKLEKYEKEKITQSGQAEFGKLVSEYINQTVNNPEFAKLNPWNQLGRIGGAFGVNINDDKLVRELIAEVREASKAVLRNNAIPEMGKPVEDLMELVKKASLPDSDVALQMDAILGKEVAGQIRQSLSASGQANIQAGLNNLLAEAANSYMVGKIRVPPMKSIPGKIWNTVNSLFYTLVLTAAPRFHGANMMGAPSVVYSTTGKLISPLPLPGTSTLDSLQALMKAGTNDGGKIIVRDAAGRSYTADEIYKILVERGGETVNAAQIPAVQARAALSALNDSPVGLSQRIFDKALELPQYEDLMYRGAVLIDSLKSGRTIEQSADLAKTALYDRGDIVSGEKILRDNIMFYAFQRNNLVNLMKNLTTVKGWQRIANTVKTKRGIETVVLSDEERKYQPSSAATRIIIGTNTSSPEANYVVALPGDSTLSGIELLSRIIALDFHGIAESGMSPGQSMFFKPSDDRDIETIPPEHMAVFGALPGVDATTIASLIAGETIVPVRSNAPGNIDGYVYPLLSQKARDRYKTTLNALGYVGIGRLMSDYPASVRAPGTKTDQAYQSGNISDDLMTGLFALGVTTPIKQMSAEQQRLRALTAQTAEGKKMLKDIDDVLIEEVKAPIEGSDITGRGAKIAASRAKVTETKAELSPKIQEYRRLGAEVASINSKIRSGTLTREEINALLPLLKENIKTMREMKRIYNISEPLPPPPGMIAPGQRRGR